MIIRLIYISLISLHFQLNNYTGEDVDRRTVTFGTDEVRTFLPLVYIMGSNEDRACRVVCQIELLVELCLSCLHVLATV